MKLGWFLCRVSYLHSFFEHCNKFVIFFICIILTEITYQLYTPYSMDVVWGRDARSEHSIIVLGRFRDIGMSSDTDSSYAIHI